MDAEVKREANAKTISNTWHLPIAVNHWFDTLYCGWIVSISVPIFRLAPLIKNSKSKLRFKWNALVIDHRNVMRPTTRSPLVVVRPFKHRRWMNKWTAFHNQRILIWSSLSASYTDIFHLNFGLCALLRWLSQLNGIFFKHSNWCPLIAYPHRVHRDKRKRYMCSSMTTTKSLLLNPFARRLRLFDSQQQQSLSPVCLRHTLSLSLSNVGVSISNKLCELLTSNWFYVLLSDSNKNNPFGIDRCM